MLIFVPKLPPLPCFTWVFTTRAIGNRCRNVAYYVANNSQSLFNINQYRNETLSHKIFYVPTELAQRSLY